ncbi:MAG: membrane-associated protease RseP (regulator of RpoE activity) [Cyclobacteriaceae bacterium]|jgi:membrane-associated protease RseP (regulator of RpoE activity)
MNKENRTRLIQLGLFIVTIITTTLAGTEWMYSKYMFFVDEEHMMSWQDFLDGFQFSIPFLLILTCHEFGHYFTARFHRIKVTLPYYIPLWLGFIVSPSFGTMGAFIKIKDKIRSRMHYFDVGVSGPLAGFVVALFVIGYGYSHLPEPDYIFKIHSEYEAYGLEYADHVYSHDFSRLQDSLRYLDYRAEDSTIFIQDKKGGIWSYPDFEASSSYPNMYFSKPLLFLIVEKYFVDDISKIPNKEEIMHNPYLLAGLLALFFTALNLLPIGQLDGGHVVFGIFGEKNSRKISAILFTIFVFYAGLGVIDIGMMESTSITGALNFLLIIIAYTYFLYLCGFSMFETKKDRWTFAAAMMASQFVIHTAFGFNGYEGWLLFSLILGRFVGIYHPPVLDNRPMSMERKIVGGIALVIFILSFSPQPFVMSI